MRATSVRRKAVADQRKQRDRDSRRADAVAKLDALRLDPVAGPIVKGLEDSYPDDPVGLDSAVTAEWADVQAEAAS